MKMKEKKAVARLLDAENITIHCRNCKLQLCQATDMRLRLNNYICTSDDSLLEKISIRKLEKPDEYRFDSKIGEIFNSNCCIVVNTFSQYPSLFGNADIVHVSCVYSEPNGWHIMTFILISNYCNSPLSSNTSGTI